MDEPAKANETAKITEIAKANGVSGETEPTVVILGPSKIKPPYNRVGRKLMRWIIFSVAAALLPIAINWFRAIAGGDSSIDFTVLVSHGELVLVCAAITAEAMGEIFVSGKAKGSLSLLAFGTCCLVFFLSSALFVIAESSPRRPDFIASSSVWMFSLTILAGGSCKVLAEL